MFLPVRYRSHAEVTVLHIASGPALQAINHEPEAEEILAEAV